jgi:hypothetical protein
MKELVHTALMTLQNQLKKHGYIESVEDVPIVLGDES